MKKIRKLLVVLCWICLTGCSGNGANSDEPKMAEKEELVLWGYYETENQKKALEELVAGFNESQDSYQLKWEYHGPASEFNKRLAIGITQDQLPDMVIIDNPDTPRYIEMDRLEDITEAVLALGDIEDYFPNVIQSVKVGERYYGLPFCCNNVALIYNKEIFAAAGVEVPEDWEAFREAAVSLTNDERQGFAMSAINGEQSAFQMATLMLSAGDDLDEAGNEGTRKAFELVQTLVTQGALSRECINWSQNDVARVFIAGECAMMENGPWVFPALEAAGINYGVARFPADERYMGVSGGENLAVIKGKNVQGSIQFLNYYNQQQVMLNTNLRANSLPPKQRVAKLLLNAKPEYQIIMEQMPECVSRTSYEKWTQLSEGLSEAQYRVIIGESTPQEACDYIKGKIK